MKTLVIRYFSLAVFLASCFFVLPAQAGPAEAHLKAKQAELTAIIKQPKSAQSEEKLKKAFDALLDYDSLAKNSLGDEWGKLSAEQQKEFQALLQTLVQRAYTKNIRETFDYDIQFKGEKDAKQGKLVATIARHKTDKRKEPVKIDYLVHQKEGSWRVYDIITEGSSLVSNYRSQFHRVIQKKGFGGLIERMRKKAGEN